MCPVQITDTISVSYTAKLDSGELIESVSDKKPVIVTIGSGKILKAVEASTLGMEPGDTRTVRVQPEDAYGPYFKDLVHELPRSSFGNKVSPKPGMILSLAIEKDGIEQQVPATVLAVRNDSVTVDYNHPLAGKAITYTVTLHSIGK